MQKSLLIQPALRAKGSIIKTRCNIIKEASFNSLPRGGGQPVAAKTDDKYLASCEHLQDRGRGCSRAGH